MIQKKIIHISLPRLRIRPQFLLKVLGFPLAQGTVEKILKLGFQFAAIHELSSVRASSAVIHLRNAARIRKRVTRRDSRVRLELPARSSIVIPE